MSSVQNITCPHCEKCFLNTSSRNRHLRSVHNDHSCDSKKTSRIICPSCPGNTCFKNFEFLNNHLTNCHDIKIEVSKLEFENEELFKTWKENTEKQTKSFYLLNSTAESTIGKIYYYECHRSNLGKFETKCKIRTPKISGSIKIEGACPSRIRAEVCQSSSKIFVSYVSSHVGHISELRCQPLTEKEKEGVITQIRNGVSYETILRNARNIESGECTRLNLLTKKDLFYIADKNKLSGKRHKSDLVAVDMKVAEWNNERDNVFIFKKPGQKYDRLHIDDFVLAFMNKEMEYMLKSYGTRIVCMDGTHGTNPYQYELSTILVLDDQDIGYPTVFLISNRKDTIIQEVLLTELKNKIGSLIPQYFMTDDTTIYWDAWNKIMGPLPKRLLCTWHIKKNWAIQGRNKIKDQEIRNKITKDMNILLKETDKKEFVRRKQQLANYLELQGETAFLEYLNKYYFQSEERIAAWAHAYRKHAGINTNMHLEALHKTIKYNYFCGKTVRRLETCLDALDMLIKDKSWKRIASILRPTANHQNLLVNKAHKLALTMSFEAVAKENPNKYLVHSQNRIDFYEVELVDSKCNCRMLRCVLCDVCIHRFRCSCYESSIKNNFCKHMHLVAMYIKLTKDNTFSVNNSPNEECDELHINIPSVTEATLQEELNLRIEVNSEKYKTTDFTFKKEKCEDLLKSILENCSNSNDYDTVIKTLIELKSQFNKANLPDKVQSTKRVIEKQTFFPAKKRK